MDFQAISPRLCKLRIRGKFFNYSLLCCHAPTEDKSDEEKETFYEHLSRAYSGCPRHDVKIVIGDMNSKLGKELEYSSVLGRYSLHDLTNDNGCRLVDFAVEHGMIAGSTLFCHKLIHKETWKAPGGTCSNQIDHVLIDARHSSDLIDVRTYRGANIDSDHYLIISRIRARLSNAKKERIEPLKTFDCEKLKNTEVKKEYAECLEKHLTEISDSDSIDEYWRKIKESVCHTSKAVVGNIERKKDKDWYDDECAELTNKKNQAYKIMLQRNTRHNSDEYKRARKEEKRLHKLKKRTFEEENLRDIDNLKTINECRAFYRKVNRSRSDFKPSSALCRDKQASYVFSR
ncbi:craniofacial development protein 2-like [Uloborus diversus]|uniref:craniofacial development protein 2-like n=1 Tax=Uloborus diversus TaxID=327109 RepID=UPI002409DAE1|nr:craniofacial development protein 2-like [Uloborus diversus]